MPPTLVFGLFVTTVCGSDAIDVPFPCEYENGTFVKSAIE
jgi:hypothetical protein